MITLTDKKGGETQHRLVPVRDLKRWRDLGWTPQAEPNPGDVDVMVWREQERTKGR